MIMKTRQLKTYGMHQKQFYEGSLQQYNLTSGNKKTLNRQPNFTPKAKEKRRKKIMGRKEIIKIQAEISEKEMKETIVKNKKTKSWFFEKINTTDKPLARIIKRKRETNQINKIRNEKGEVTIYSAETQRIIKDY